MDKKKLGIPTNFTHPLPSVSVLFKNKIFYASSHCKMCKLLIKEKSGYFSPQGKFYHGSHGEVQKTRSTRDLLCSQSHHWSTCHLTPHILVLWMMSLCLPKAFCAFGQLLNNTLCFPTKTGSTVKWLLEALVGLQRAQKWWTACYFPPALMAGLPLCSITVKVLVD